MTETAPPTVVIAGRYRLLSEIGSGGMGTVWRARDETLRRDVAIKEFSLPTDMPAAEQAMLRERMLREARAAAALTHPSVITIYDVVDFDDRPWIVMELLPSRTLLDVVNQDGPMDPAVVAGVGKQLLGALTTAHRAGVLHRDVKPGNILLDEHGRATLGDFGVARSLNEPSLTGTGVLVGSPSYMAPERARGEEPSEASDLWALGATLFTAVEGHAAFDRGDPMPTLTAVVGEAQGPYLHAGPLAPVLDGLLTKNPTHRWDAATTRRGLEAALGKAGGRAHATPAHPQIPVRHRIPVKRQNFLDDVFDTAMSSVDTSIDLDRDELPQEWESPADDTAAAPVSSPPMSEPPAVEASPAEAPTTEASRADTTMSGAREVLPPARRFLPPTGHKPRPRRTRRTAKIAAVVLAAVAGIAVLAIIGYALGDAFSGRGADTAPRSRAASSSAPSAAPSPSSAGGSQSKKASPTASESGRSVSDPLGFQTVVPAGWTPRRSGTTVDYRDPSEDRFLRFRVSSAPARDQEAVFRAGERAFTRHDDVSGYVRMSLGPATVAGQRGARWHFRYTDTSTNQQREVRYEAYERDGTSYQLYLSAPRSRFNATQWVLTRAANSYQAR